MGPDHMASSVFVQFDSLRPSQQFFQLCRDGSSWVEPVLSKDGMYLAQGHNTVMPVRLEPAAPRP